MDFTNKHDKFYSDILKVREHLNANSTRLNNHLEALKSHDSVIETFKHNFDEIYEHLEQMQIQKMDNSSYEKELGQIRKDIKVLKIVNEDTYNSLQMTDNYLHRYLKVEIMNEITEAIF